MAVLSQVLAQYLIGNLRAQQQAQAMERNQALLTSAMGFEPTAQPPIGTHPGRASAPVVPGQPGAGLLADPFNPLNQLEFAGALMGSPELAGVGGSIFNQVLSQQGLDRRAELNRRMQSLQFEEEQAAKESQFQRTLGHTEVMAFLDDYLERRAAADERAAAGGVELGTVPAGYERRRIRDPGSGQVFNVMAPSIGHPDQVKAREKLQTNDATIRQVDQLLQLGGTVGKESFGQVSGQMGTLHGQIVSGIGRLRGFGVLQPSELEMIEKSLGDPSKLGFKRWATIAAQLMTLRQLLVDDYNYDRNNYAFYPGMEDLLGFNFAEPGSTAPPPPGTEALSPDEEAAARAGLAGPSP